MNLIDNCKESNIKFPSHEEKNAVEGFRRKSAVNFSNCIGHIDSILVWHNKFSYKDFLGTNNRLSFLKQKKMKISDEFVGSL